MLDPLDPTFPWRTSLLVHHCPDRADHEAHDYIAQSERQRNVNGPVHCPGRSLD